MEHCGQSTKKKMLGRKACKKNPFLWGVKMKIIKIIQYNSVLGAQVLVCKVLKACLTNNSM